MVVPPSIAASVMLQTLMNMSPVWAGRVLTEHPELGLDRAAELVKALRDVDGASPPVARSQLGILLRSVGRDDVANVASRWLR